MTIIYTLTAPADHALTAEPPNQAIKLPAGQSTSGSEMNGDLLHCVVKGVLVWMNTKGQLLTQTDATVPPPSTPPPPSLSLPSVKLTQNIDPNTGQVTIVISSIPATAIIHVTVPSNTVVGRLP